MFMILMSSKGLSSLSVLVFSMFCTTSAPLRTWKHSGKVRQDTAAGHPYKSAQTHCYDHAQLPLLLYTLA